LGVIILAVFGALQLNLEIFIEKSMESVNSGPSTMEANKSKANQPIKNRPILLAGCWVKTMVNQTNKKEINPTLSSCSLCQVIPCRKDDELYRPTLNTSGHCRMVTNFIYYIIKPAVLAQTTQDEIGEYFLCRFAAQKIFSKYQIRT
jgi:hypothetical protein